jgi:hypothetical protein
MPSDPVERILGVCERTWPESPQDRDRPHRAERSPPMHLPSDYGRLRMIEHHCQELRAEAARARRVRQLPATGVLAHSRAGLIAVVRKAFQSGQRDDHPRRRCGIPRLTLG